MPLPVPEYRRQHSTPRASRLVLDQGSLWSLGQNCSARLAGLALITQAGFEATRCSGPSPGKEEISFKLTVGDGAFYAIGRGWLRAICCLPFSYRAWFGRRWRHRLDAGPRAPGSFAFKSRKLGIHRIRFLSRTYRRGAGSHPMRCGRGSKILCLGSRGLRGGLRRLCVCRGHIEQQKDIESSAHKDKFHLKTPGRSAAGLHRYIQIIIRQKNELPHKSVAYRFVGGAD
jgi:hypothetical protein